MGTYKIHTTAYLFFAVQRCRTSDALYAYLGGSFHSTQFANATGCVAVHCLLYSKCTLIDETGRSRRWALPNLAGRLCT